MRYKDLFFSVVFAVVISAAIVLFPNWMKSEPEMTCEIARTLDVPTWVDGEKSVTRIETHICTLKGEM